MRPLVTEVFFPGEPLNVGDRLLSAVVDARRRARLLAVPESAGREPGDPLAFRFDIVLQGERETPFFED
jgi:protocatechuate 3,4-dioxygenase beta subunit